MITALRFQLRILRYSASLLLTLTLSGFLGGCTPRYVSSSYPSASYDVIKGGGQQARRESLFPSTEEGLSLFDGENPILTEESIAEILKTQIKLPDTAHIAVLQMPTRAFNRSYYYYYSEEDQRVQREILDSINMRLQTSGHVKRTSSLPSLLVPAEPTIPVLREIGVRLQADMILVYRVTGDLFYNYRVFAKDQYKAYSTCEAVLVDVRTGIIPFTTVATTNFLTEKQSTDLNDYDAGRRAELQAITKSVNVMSDSVAAYLRKL